MTPGERTTMGARSSRLPAGTIRRVVPTPPADEGGNASAFLQVPRHVDLFRGVPENESGTIALHWRGRRFPRGAQIFSRNDPSDALYLLLEGLVKLVARAEMGRETILHILRPGEIFGELLFTEERRPFSAIAITDLRAAAIPRERFAELLAAFPAVSLNFIRILSRRLMKVERGVAEHSHTLSYHRLAKTLLDLSRNYGEEVRGGVLIRLRLTHADLANLIGTTRETVTTQLNRFKRMGLVGTRGQRIIVRRGAFAEFARREEIPIRREYGYPFDESA